jgi:S1-C subfamily serine protease
MRQRIESGARLAGVAAVALVLLAGTAHAAATVAVGAEHAQTGKTAVARVPGYLGIGFHDLTDEQAAAMRLKGGHGVEILLVDHDGPAGKSDLRPHDVIVSLNGQPVASAESLHKMIRDAAAGTTVTLGVQRNGQTQRVTVQLAERADVEREAIRNLVPPGPPPAPAGDPVVSGFVESYTIEQGPAATVSGPNFLELMLHTTPFTGLAMEEMGPQLAQFFGSPTGSGLLVHTVMPNSPAAESGLRAGDVVIKVDGAELRSSSEWMKRLKAAKGQAMSLTVLRDKRETTLTLTPVFKKHASVEWPLAVLGEAFFSA